MNHLWLVRTVALLLVLLVLLGLQAGSFRDLDSGHERYYGTEDYSAAVRAEGRKPEAVPLPLPAAQPPSALQATPFSTSLAPARRPAAARAFTPHHIPDPTGPPRA